ncbi:hypothetical protein [Flavobacterium sp. YJ01]|uniref:hypothetical protein n=1 Tax=unclassified Flavobacterium TaxID=196869 RepID=UPI0023E3A8BF|nr:hypothetical protein [Flavobacterium sp. YJ01]WET02372.1 hypothetical protein P0R33_21705 [Flavobacterium sp. YJ01]
MKKNTFKLFTSSLLFGALALSTACSSDDNKSADPVNPVTDGRWITVAGALMQTDPGDGNGGTRVYAISKENAIDPNFSVDVYANGKAVQSSRTARLQSSVDGSTLFNITYTGANGGEFMTYKVTGGNNFAESTAKVNISQYAGTSPRWVKLFDGDKTGVAVNVATPVVSTNEDKSYKNTRGIATVLSLDMQQTLIAGYKQYQIPLTAEEEALGHHIFRLDAPTLNKAGNKLIIGTWMRKSNPANPATNESSFTRLGSKSVVVDYPSLENPKVITSTVGFGDTSGYRSFNSFVATDGNIYQATQRDTQKGSYILKINQSNEYDNSYVFSLDSALGIKGSYIDAWRYVGNGIAYAVYTHEGTEQGFLARLDLNARTAQKVQDIAYDADLNFGQYQGFVVDGNNFYIAVTPVGKDGNIYVIDIPTGKVTKGAKLVNKPGNHYIGVF